MPKVLLDDRRAYLRVGADYDVSFSNALLWLAVATAPSPRSRYRPASRWTIAKYSTVCDPRRRYGRSPLFVTNPGVADLDPHQKAVLSDDVGMALALGLLDQIYGISGLADVYAYVQAGRLTLTSKGRHRKMPDYVLKLRNPIRGSRIVLLECKGSVIPGRANIQLTTACTKQLANVADVDGASARTIPKLAIAAELALGRQVTVHVSDPDEITQHPTSEQLKANLLALEFAFFGDLNSANQVWKAYDLPVFPDAGQSLPSPDELRFSDEAITGLQAGKFKVEGQGPFERQADQRQGYALTTITAEAPQSLMHARQAKAWASVTKERDQDARATSAQAEPDDSSGDNRREIREVSKTSNGILVQTRTRIWYE